MTVRAATLEELAPLQALCESGRLFEVQEWVRIGKPVALPEEVRISGRRARSPLHVAMERGFYSLVQVLLEAGAPVREGSYHALRHAVKLGRSDLAALLIEHGAQVEEVPTAEVLERWDPTLVNLFLTNGADLHDGYPVARGLVKAVRPMLSLLKRPQLQGPALTMQVEFALRYHAYEGHVQAVALLLWAGADPWARGPYRLDDLHRMPVAEKADEDAMSAVELAVLYNHLDVLKIRGFATRPDPHHPGGGHLLRRVLNCEVLNWLLDHGQRPDALDDRGTERIIRWLSSLTFCGTSYNSRGREYMKMVHIFVSHGARWLPADRLQLNRTRGYLLRMTPDYTLEFLWILQQHQAARRADVDALIRNPTMTRLLGNELARAQGFVADTPENLV